MGTEHDIEESILPYATAQSRRGPEECGTTCRGITRSNQYSRVSAGDVSPGLTINVTVQPDRLETYLRMARFDGTRWVLLSMMPSATDDLIVSRNEMLDGDQPMTDRLNIAIVGARGLVDCSAASR